MMKRRRVARKSAGSFAPRIDVEEWMQNNPDLMVHCPNQPGGLKLTKGACAKRHATANEPRYANIGAEPFHVFVFKMNLVPCKSCEIGARMAAEQKAQVA